MLYSNDKKVLKTIRKSEPTVQGTFYDNDEIWKVVCKKYPRITRDKFLSSLYCLADDGFIQYANNSGMNFRLNSKGLYYYEHCWKMLLYYASEKWIDFFALATSIIALIVAILAYVKP